MDQRVQHDRRPHLAGAVVLALNADAGAVAVRQSSVIPVTRMGRNTCCNNVPGSISSQSEITKGPPQVRSTIRNHAERRVVLLVAPVRRVMDHDKLSGSECSSATGFPS